MGPLSHTLSCHDAKSWKEDTHLTHTRMCQVNNFPHWTSQLSRPLFPESIGVFKVEIGVVDQKLWPILVVDYEISYPPNFWVYGDLKSNLSPWMVSHIANTHSYEVRSQFGSPNWSRSKRYCFVSPRKIGLYLDDPLGFFKFESIYGLPFTCPMQPWH